MSAALSATGVTISAKERIFDIVGGLRWEGLRGVVGGADIVLCLIYEPSDSAWLFCFGLVVLNQRRGQHRIASRRRRQ